MTVDSLTGRPVTIPQPAPTLILLGIYCLSQITHRTTQLENVSPVVSREAMGCGCTSLLEFSIVFAYLELGWEGKGRLGEGVGRACIVRIDSLFLCDAFTIMKFELRSEESRTITIGKRLRMAINSGS